MQITIDTKRDTKEEIKKAIDLLLNFVDESKVVTNDPQDVFGSPDVPMSDMSNFFDAPPTKEKSTQDNHSDEDLGLELI